MVREKYFYSFIDGAFLEEARRHYEHISGCAIYNYLNWDVFGKRRFRTVYYDALPVQKQSESNDVFTEKYERKRASLDRIRSAEDCYVREGITRLRQSERLEQKGVDMWIAADVVRTALQGSADVLEIWTSDADLYPVFEVLRDSRCKSRLRYMEGHAIEALVASAGGAKPIRFLDFLSEFEPSTLVRFGIDRYSSRELTTQGWLQRNGLSRVEELTISQGSWTVAKSTDDYWSFISEGAGQIAVLRSGHPLGILEELYDGTSIDEVERNLKMLLGK